MPKIQDISRSKLVWILKFLVFGLGVVYIYQYSLKFSEVQIHLTAILSHQKFLILISVLLVFASLNWFGEIKKWQGLVGHISIELSAKQSLIAHGMSLFTPQKLGEYGGKCLFYAKAEHYKIIALTGVGHFTQLVATLMFGVFGVVVLFSEFNVFRLLSLKWSWLFLILAFIVLLKLFRRQLETIFIHLKSIERQKIVRAQGWSLFRYVMFAHQFYFLLNVFEIKIDYMTATAVISMVYLMASILPVFSIADAIVKGSLAITIFGAVGFTEPSILTIAFLMWISNAILPALVGYVWMLKWRPKLLMFKV